MTCQCKMYFITLPDGRQYHCAIEVYYYIKRLEEALAYEVDYYIKRLEEALAYERRYNEMRMSHNEKPVDMLMETIEEMSNDKPKL